MPWGEIVRAGPPVPFPRGVVSDHISPVAPLVFLGAGPTGGLVLQAEGGTLGAPDLASALESPHVVASCIAHCCSSSSEAGPGGEEAVNALERTLWVFLSMCFAPSPRWSLPLSFAAWGTRP